MTHPVPFEGYDDLSVDDIVDRLKKATADEVAAVKAYENAKAKPRKTLLTAIDGLAPKPFAPKGRPPLVEVAEELAAENEAGDDGEPVEAGDDDREEQD